MASSCLGPSLPITSSEHGLSVSSSLAPAWSAEVNGRPSPGFMTRLGVPWLWGADVERGWTFMRFNVVPITGCA